MFTNSSSFFQELSPNTSISSAGEDDNPTSHRPTLVTDICDQNVAGVEKFIKDGIDVDCAEHGSLPLCVASKVGNLAIVDMLIKAGARVDKMDDNMNMPLNLAAKYGHTKIVERILKENPSEDVINNIDADNHTPLVSAATNLDIAILKQLLHVGAKVNYPHDPDDKRTYYNPTWRFPLSAVIRRIDPVRRDMFSFEYEMDMHCVVDCVTELIKAGADLSDKSYLVKAVENPEVVRVLLDSGCNTEKIMDAIFEAMQHPEAAPHLIKAESNRWNESTPTIRMKLYFSTWEDILKHEPTYGRTNNSSLFIPKIMAMKCHHK